MEDWNVLLPTLLTDLYTRTAQLGGTISGEHGIGSKRKNYLPLALEPAVIALMKSLKATFDPNNILNPGKIFPE
jgi:glycolate oxidase